MNRTITTSIMAIGLVAAMLSVGTFAYFSDTETSTGNTFVAGTLDLKVANGDEVFGDGVTATWTMDDMVPGVTTVTATMSLMNSSSVSGNHVEIAFSHTIDEATNPVESDTDPDSSPSDLAKWIEITSITYNGVDLMTTLSDLNGNGWLDLEDVTLGANAAEGGPLDDLPTPLSNNAGVIGFAMSLAFRAEATNDIQGDILTTTIAFTLNQDSNQ